MKLRAALKLKTLYSLRFIVGLLVAVIVIISNSSVGVTSYNMISKEKKLDTFAILYLDIERKIAGHFLLLQGNRGRAT